MARIVSIRRAALLVLLMAVFAFSASLAVAQTTLDPKDFESNSLLFVQQDVLPSFGNQVGVRVGTVRGLINGNINTNFFFTVPPPGPPAGGLFVADDTSLITDPDGDQILFKIHAEGTASFNSLDASITLFTAPYLATYTVQDATGKFAKYKGRVFPARGTGVVSTPVFTGVVPGTPVGTVYVEVSRNPIHK